MNAKEKVFRIINRLNSKNFSGDIYILRMNAFSAICLCEDFFDATDPLSPLFDAEKVSKEALKMTLEFIAWKQQRKMSVMAKLERRAIVKSLELVEPIKKTVRRM